MSQPDHDIIIAGAGPVGTALALMLARHTHRPERIALAGRALGTPLAGHDDPRTLALNHGSQALLATLNAWPAQTAAITTVHVSQRGRLGRTVISPENLGVETLGYVAGYGPLLATLHEQARQAGITCLEGEFDNGGPQPGRASGIVAGRQLTARLLVQSDGVRPTQIFRQYNQHAILAQVRASLPRAGWAFERFTRQGPLALLPHPAGADTWALVWCTTPGEAEHLRHLPAHDFNTALNDCFGARLGHLQLCGERAVFPLTLHAGPQRLGNHAVAIGNAAQTLHPVAGQGLNLGLRDAAQLAQSLAPWLARPHTPVGDSLDHFLNRRRADRWVTTAITDTLPRVFTTGNPLVEHACGLALLAMDLLPPLREPLARHLLHGLRR